MDDASNSANLSSKIISIAAGESHTIALTGDGYVYSWGRGMFGRLGTGSEEDEHYPVRVKFDFPGKFQGQKLKIVGIAAGAYHSLALADNGSVWCWGYNIYGQLGIDGENCLVPRLIEPFLELGASYSLENESGEESKAALMVFSVKAGGMMSLAIDNVGALWMWGNCPKKSSDGDGESGFSLVSSFTPVPVWGFHGHTVVKVACGNEHVIALVSAGETYKGEDLVCYSWGNNNHGQLGLGDKENRVHPQAIETFDQDSPWVVYEISCGAFHSALLTHKKTPNDRLESFCWTFGLGENGQLGHGTTQTELVPKLIKELPQQHVYLLSVDCGLFHTSVVSSAGYVWSWGMEKGLGLCPDARFTGIDAGDAASPIQIQTNDAQNPHFLDPVQVVCGAAHTVLVAHDGYKLWSWGRGRSGVLGNGKTDDCYSPSIVLWPTLTEELNSMSNEDRITDNKLCSAIEEIKLLQSKLSKMELYATMLHGSIFGKPFDEQDIPISLRNSGDFDILKEWEKMLDSEERGKLIRLEGFYRKMLAVVKDKLLKRRIEEIIKESLHSQ